MKNNYVVMGDYVIIELLTKTVPKYTVIDIEDLPRAKEISGRWYAQYRHDKGVYYVAGGIGEGYKKVLLHRWLTDCPKGMTVDHKNHDTLDNRRQSNLRVVTNQQNTFNKKGARSDSTTGVRGVSWVKKDNSYRARIKYKGKVVYEKYFKDLEDASVAIEKERAKYEQG